jgi:hypothetical protein
MGNRYLFEVGLGNFVNIAMPDGSLSDDVILKSELEKTIVRIGGGSLSEAVLYSFVFQNGYISRNAQPLCPDDGSIVYWLVDAAENEDSATFELYRNSPTETDGEQPLLEVSLSYLNGQEQWGLVVFQGSRRLVLEQQTGGSQLTGSQIGYWVGPQVSFSFAPPVTSLLWLRPDARELVLCVKCLVGGMLLPEGVEFGGSLVLRNGEKVPLEMTPTTSDRSWVWPIPQEIEEDLFENAQLVLDCNLRENSNPTIELREQVQVASFFTQIRLGANKAGLSDDEQLEYLELGAESGQPFPVKIAGRLGGRRGNYDAPDWSTEFVLTRETLPEDQRESFLWCRYKAETAVTVPSTVARPSDLVLQLSSQPESPGSICLVRGALRGIWTLRINANDDVEPPMLHERFLTIPQEQAAALGWSGTSFGLIRYSDGEEVNLLDGDFRPFFPPAYEGDAGGFVGGKPELKFKMSVPEEQSFYPSDIDSNGRHVFDDEGFILGEFQRWMQRNKVVRIEASRGRRGVWTQTERTDGTYGSIENKWVEFERKNGRVFIMEPQGDGYKAKLWFRGLAGAVRICELGTHYTVLLKKSWSIDMNVDPDIGPFLPLRAWCKNGEARLQAGKHSLSLREQNGIWWANEGEELEYEYEGESFAPKAPVNFRRMAWRGLVFDLLNGEPRFWGWCWSKKELTLNGEAFGPFGEYSFAFKMGSEFTTIKIQRSKLMDVENLVEAEFPVLCQSDREALCGGIRALFMSDGRPVELKLRGDQIVFMLDGRFSDPDPLAPISEVVLSVRSQSNQNEPDHADAHVRLFHLAEV